MIKAPVRVLHVVGSLECGGVESWVLQLAENLDPKRIQVDIMVNRPGGMFEGIAQAHGIKILCCGQPASRHQYSQNFNRLLMENGSYQVVHSHVQLWSGFVLSLAKQAGVPGRIAHARSTKDGQRGKKSSFIYQVRMRHLIKGNATHLMAVSAQAAEGTFWKGVMNHGDCQLVTGIDFAPFTEYVDRNVVRAQLEIPPGTPVIGHVGNFRPAKNYPFILEIARKIIPIQPDVIFLLVGGGPLKSSMEEAVLRLGLAGHFRFLGERNDVPRMLQAMDVFIFPSVFEGFGRALLEAQAVGLPCIAANHIPPETAATATSVHFLSLEAGSEKWVQSILAALQGPISYGRGIEAIRLFEQRGLSIAGNAAKLTQLYESIAENDLSTRNPTQQQHR
jgi:glycosyltransferase involved in cell wall biosynthesis